MDQSSSTHKSHSHRKSHHHNHHHNRHRRHYSTDFQERSHGKIPDDAQELVKQFGENQVKDVYSRSSTKQISGLTNLCSAIKELSDPDKKADLIEILFPIFQNMLESNDLNIFTTAVQQVESTLESIPDSSFPYDFCLDLLKTALMRFQDENAQIVEQSVGLIKWSVNLDESYLDNLADFIYSDTEEMNEKTKLEMFQFLITQFDPEKLRSINIDQFFKFMIPNLLSKNQDTNTSSIQIFISMYQLRPVKFDLVISKLEKDLQNLFQMIIRQNGSKVNTTGESKSPAKKKSLAQQMNFLNELFGHQTMSELNSANTSIQTQAYIQITESLQKLKDVDQQYEAFDTLQPYVKQMFQSDIAIIFTTAVDHTAITVVKLQERGAFSSCNNFPHNQIKELVELAAQKLRHPDPKIEDSSISFMKWAVEYDITFLTDMINLVLKPSGNVRLTSNFPKNKLDLMHMMILKYDKITINKVKVEDMMKLILNNYENMNQETKDMALTLYRTCYGYYGSSMERYVKAKPKKVQEEIFDVVGCRTASVNPQNSSSSVLIKKTLKNSGRQLSSSLLSPNYKIKQQMTLPSLLEPPKQYEKTVMTQEQENEAYVLIDYFGKDEISNLYSTTVGAQVSSLRTVCDLIKARTNSNEQLEAFLNLFVILKRMFQTDTKILYATALDQTISLVTELQEDDAFLTIGNFPHDQVAELIDIVMPKMSNPGTVVKDTTVKFIAWAVKLDASFISQMMDFIFSPNKNDKNDDLYQSKLRLLNAIVFNYETEITNRLELDDLMNFMNPGLDSKNEETKKRAIQLFSTCYKQYGPQMKLYIQDKPELLRNEIYIGSGIPIQSLKNIKLLRKDPKKKERSASVNTVPVKLPPLNKKGKF